jgi:ferredoxin-NADP reductase/Na+-translocating ferredoxin:NAD+ oxidoreductase RnfD subunit
MIDRIDHFLNGITMYRLVLYYLIILLAVAALLGIFGIIPRDPAAILFSTAVITAVCWVANRIFARVFGAVENVESVYITAFILALIIEPVASKNYTGIGFLVFASAWAMASKYIFAIGKKHLFNPAALGVALSAIFINQSATWWVGGNLPLLPFVFVGGILIVRKIHRFDLVLSFSIAALAMAALTSSSGNYLGSITETLLHSSFFFLAFVMLTEPLTTPPNQAMRIAYGALIGFLFTPSIHVGSFYSTPEIALLIGNVFSYLASPKERLMLALESVEKIGADAYDFVFASDRPLSFRPGQYLEWTLGHKSPDDRGNRRYFTIASSPTEKDIRLGVKFYSPPSSFKKALAAMKEGDTIFASQLAGNFVLPKNEKKKLVFIAGGIGITPFRSMIQYLLDTKEQRSVALFYSNKKADDVAYKDVFDRAQKELGIKTVYLATAEKSPVPGMYTESLNPRIIAREVPDYLDRIFFISGPHSMVDAFETTLRDMGVPRRKIKIDFFPGYA